MTKAQIKEGMRVRFTGDAYNFGEDWTVPEDKGLLGTVVLITSSDDRWDALVKWDAPVRGPMTENQYYYRAASLSPARTAGF